MTPEQKASYVNAQVALLNAEIAGMQAANTYREGRGETIAYGEDEFGYLFDQYKPILHSDALIKLFGEEN